MNISTNLRDEQIDPGKPPFGYEWWYFDALSTDGEWGVVVIFYEGNPFSPSYIKSEKGSAPEDYPAVSISLYRNSKHEFYGFEEVNRSRFSFQDDPLSVKVGSNQFVRSVFKGRIEYNLILDQKLDSGHRLTGTLRFSSSDTSRNLIQSENPDGRHFWNLLSPRAKVTGQLTVKGRTNNELINFQGLGYHDHNTGYEPMKDSFGDWYWGRVHFKDCTLIYYIMNQLDGRQYDAWLIDQLGGKVLDTFSDISLEGYRKSLLGLNSARRVILRSPRNTVYIEQDQILDNGPFYQRFNCKGSINGEYSENNVKGISEYIVPGRIYDERFWWMIRMRLRFTDKNPHWVQRSKFFYELTW